MTSSGQVGSTWQQTMLAERQRSRATNVIARSIFWGFEWQSDERWKSCKRGLSKDTIKVEELLKKMDS